MKRSLLKIVKESSNVGVERGVATIGAQVVWPMMIVTVTNFEGFNSPSLVIILIQCVAVELWMLCTRCYVISCIAKKPFAICWRAAYVAMCA